MTAETTTSLNNFLTDMIAPLQESFPKRTVLSDELKRNTRRENFRGLQVRVPLLLTPKQGTGGVAQTGTLNIARQLDDRAAFITMARFTHAIELSVDLIKAAEGSNFVAAGSALKLHMEQAEVALSRVENEALNGDGTGLLAGPTTSATTNTTLVVLGTAANYYPLYPGRIVDLFQTGGTSVSASRTIVSATSTSVTLDAAVTATTGTAIYIEGTFGNSTQGIKQPFATSGTFEGIDLGSVIGFRAIDGRGTTAAADLSMSIMDGAFRRVMQASGKAPDFWIGDPAAIDKFGQGLVSQFRWQPKIVRLDTGWEGIDYRGTPLIPEFDVTPGELYGINKSAITIYGFDNGPNWDDMDGNRFRRFNRSLPVEAWLVDFLQLGIHQPNALVRMQGLNQAS